ncbi:Diphthamide biosynthesis protein 4 [Didymella pomorum]|jgi:diphthamide biosynthesis protein 4|uniref:Diphthamide biosynthesis protein 4 n=1 Tax=Didymella pomorum TaxID=749634 RepID=A0A9W9D8I5_9PLEO|nr:Diphthamide biosynthesis protein 4 [Didymella pomorum]
MAYTKNYYHILGLSAPSTGNPSARPQSAELRRAYRNALLKAHPDKQSATRAGERTLRGYTVDDVKEAYRVLDDARTRDEYENWVLRNPHVLQSTRDDGGGEVTLSADFVLGLDVLDLSDFEEGEEGEWTRACRCGDGKGFRILEVDLEDAEMRGEKEVLVGCGGCSLWVRVGFDVEEG